MSILRSIKRVLGRDDLLDREEVGRLRGLPAEQARQELISLLYAECERRASNFVGAELAKGDSPFRGISASAFFHEMMAVTLWILDKEIGGGALALAGELHNLYFVAFGSVTDSPDERHGELLRKYGEYAGSWNDETGHLDAFGLMVARNISAETGHDRMEEKKFWIISYAHDTARSAGSLKRPFKRIEAMEGVLHEP